MDALSGAAADLLAGLIGIGGGGGGIFGGGGGSYSAVFPSFAQSGAQAGNGQVGFCTPLAGTPGSPNCKGQSVTALQAQYGGSLNAAANALGFASVMALQAAIGAFCAG